MLLSSSSGRHVKASAWFQGGCPITVGSPTCSLPVSTCSTPSMRSITASKNNTRSLVASSHPCHCYCRMHTWHRDGRSQHDIWQGGSVALRFGQSPPMSHRSGFLTLAKRSWICGKGCELSEFQCRPFSPVTRSAPRSPTICFWTPTDSQRHAGFWLLSRMKRICYAGYGHLLVRQHYCLVLVHISQDPPTSVKT